MRPISFFLEAAYLAFACAVLWPILLYAILFGSLVVLPWRSFLVSKKTELLDERRKEVNP